jgi:hypothetical protein
VIETIHRVAALRKKLERNDNADERAWPLACAALLISASGHSRPRRADSRFGHVGSHRIATEFCVAAEFRDVPSRHGFAQDASRRLLVKSRLADRLRCWWSRASCRVRTTINQDGPSPSNHHPSGVVVRERSRSRSSDPATRPQPLPKQRQDRRSMTRMVRLHCDRR